MVVLETELNYTYYMNCRFHLRYRYYLPYNIRSTLLTVGWTEFATVDGLSLNYLLKFAVSVANYRSHCMELYTLSTLLSRTL